MFAEGEKLAFPAEGAPRWEHRGAHLDGWVFVVAGAPIRCPPVLMRSFIWSRRILVKAVVFKLAVKKRRGMKRGGGREEAFKPC